MAVFGFIGAGIMGSGMAANLAAKGHTVRVLAHRNRERIEALKAKGCQEAESHEALIKGADAVFLCLPSSIEVRETIEALTPHFSAGQVVIDTTTADPDSTEAIAAELKAKKVDFADAPVTRGQAEAEAGKLVSWVGALKRVFKRVEPWLACYSERIEHLGPVGAGHSAKLITNFVSLGQTALIVAAVKAAREAEIDLHKLYSLMMMGAARSGSLERLMGPALQGDYTGFKFTIVNAAKDVRYARALMLGLGVDTALANAMMHEYDSFVDRGMGDQLLSELLKP